MEKPTPTGDPPSSVYVAGWSPTRQRASYQITIIYSDRGTLAFIEPEHAPAEIQDNLLAI